MAYKPEILLQLFTDISQKAEISLDHANAETLAEEINQYDNQSSVKLNGKYLYETYRKTKVAVENKLPSVDFSPSYMNRLAQFIDFRDFGQYKNSIEGETTRENQSGTKPKELNQHITQYGKNNIAIARDFKGDLKLE